MTANRERLVVAGLIGAGVLAWALGLAADKLGLGSSSGYDVKQIVAAQVGVALVMAAAIFASRRSLSLPRIRRPRGRPSLAQAAAAAAALVFIAVTIWWVIDDGGLPNGDAGRHLLITSNYFEAVKRGELWYPLDSPPVIDEEFYPPFVHLIGVLGSLIGGYGIVSTVLTLNFIFVPLLALGCYGIGSYLFNRAVGALAVVFALGTPILISQFHVFMLDAPLTALVAVSVWCLLLSECFSRLGMSAIAGLVVGCGVMTKATFPLFVAGVVAVMLIRGGWRNWRGLTIFAGVVLLISQPWLMLHEDLLRDRADRALDMDRENPHAQGALGNYGAYFWGALNVQLLLPLFAFFVVGLALSVWHIVRRQARNGTAELVAGVLVGIVAVASMDWFNVRYNMPLLPYAAVIGVAWIPAIRIAGLRFAAAAAVVAIAVTNTVMINSGAGGLTRVDAPLSDEHVTFFSDGGYVENQPRDETWLPELLEAAHAAGARQVIFHPDSMNTGSFNLNALAVVGRAAGLSVRPPNLWQELAPEDIYVTKLFADPSRPNPCISLAGGERGIYVYRGGPVAEGKPTWCPPGWERRAADYF